MRYSKITCPWCNIEEEIENDFFENEEAELITCSNCEKDYYVEKQIVFHYSTYKADYGNCPICKEENVVLEDYHGSIGSHDKMCIDCGYKQQKRLKQAYFDSLPNQLNPKSLPQHIVL